MRPNADTQLTTRQVGINVDARPVIIQKEPNKISAHASAWNTCRRRGPVAAGGDSPEPSSSSLSQRLTLNLESGKPMMVSQAADPTSDRKITVEVTATILK